jgi:zinc transport system substrate-binding protein
MILVMMIIFPGCGEEEKIDIYASIYPVYYITDYIVEDKLVVKQVYPTGADVHEYDPGNGKEIVKMSKAKVMFYIGAGLEGFINKSKPIFDKHPIKLVELSANLQLCKQTNDGFEYLTEEDSKKMSLADTHVWLDPLRMLSMAEVVLQNVIEIDPENQEFYQENFNSLKERLVKLDNEYTLKLNDEDFDKIIMVDHDSYLYWEERYGIKRIRTRIDNESCDATPSNIEKNIELARAHNIKFIVTTQNETVCGIIDKYASTLEAEVVEINHLSTLYKSDIENQRDYFKIMYDNLNILLRILPKK